MLKGKSLKHPDRDSSIIFSSHAFSLAGMKTNTTANCGEGYLFPDHGYRLGRFTLTNESHIARYINTSRASLIAWCLNFTIL